MHNFRNLHIIIFVSIKWKSGKVKKSGIRNRVKLKHKSGNYYVSIELISVGSGDPVACWVCCLVAGAALVILPTGYW